MIEKMNYSIRFVEMLISTALTKILRKILRKLINKITINLATLFLNLYKVYKSTKISVFPYLWKFNYNIYYVNTGYVDFDWWVKKLCFAATVVNNMIVEDLDCFPVPQSGLQPSVTPVAEDLFWHP